MMKKSVFVLFYTIFVLLIISSIVSAQKELRISATIEGSATYLNYVFKLNPGIERFSFEIPKGSSIIYVNDNYGDVEYEMVNEGTKTDSEIKINFKKGLEISEERIVLIKLKTKELVSRKTRYYEFVYDLKTDKNFTFTLNLPETTIKNTIEFSPEGIVTEDSGSYAIEWKIVTEADGDKNISKIFLVRYSTQEQSLWFGIILSAIIIAILIVMIIFRIKRKREEKMGAKEAELEKRKDDNETGKEMILDEEKIANAQKQKLLDSLKLLNEKEKAVIEYILKNEGNEGCLQSNLQKEIGYTKSNLTKIIKKLEFRGVVKRKKIGKINRLYLGEKMK